MFWRCLRGVAFGTKSVAVIGRRGPAQIAIMMNWKTYEKTGIGMTPNVRDQRRRAVGAPLADRILGKRLAVRASGVTTRADRCIA